MQEQASVAVDVPLVGDERHKNWAKVVSSVDDSRASGWAFEGDFIAAGGIQDVPIGAVVLVYGEKGSRANPQAEAHVFVAHADGTLTLEGSARGRAWARTLRDRVAELVIDEQRPAIRRRGWHPELSAYDDAALVEELARRGYEVRPR